MNTKLHEFIIQKAKDACENYLESASVFLKRGDDKYLEDLQEIFNLSTMRGMKKAFEHLKKAKAKAKDYDEMELCFWGTLQSVQLNLWHYEELLDIVIEEQTTKKDGAPFDLVELRKFMTELGDTIKYEEAFPC